MATPAPKKRPARVIDANPDTLPLENACLRLGVSPSLGGRLAREGLDLCVGVRILRFGSPGSDRPVYRVSKAQIDAVLAPAEVVAS